MRHQWYVPENGPDPDTGQKLVYTLQEMGVEVHCNKYVPFGGMDYGFLDPNRPVVAFTVISNIKDVQRKNIYFSPFAWCDFYNLKCSTYYAWYGPHIAQKLYAMYPLGEISRNKDFIYNTFSRDDMIFVRPDDNGKTFNGELVHKQCFDGWFRHCRDQQAGQDCPCVVSRPEKIDKEWRFIIKDGKVITGSQYYENRHLNIDPIFPDVAAAKAEEIAKCLWEPHRIFVMDIALIEEEYRLLEIGSINVAGLYGCDIRKFVQAVYDLTEEEFTPRK